MRDLRKQALLESGKTTSRKARSKQAQLSPSDKSTPSSSRNTSRHGSRQGSRHGSRTGSEDEGELSDTTEWSTNSIEELLAEADDDVPAASWIADLDDRIGAICDRKRTNAESREENLQAFNTDLTRHYAVDEIKPRIDELLQNLIKSVKGGSERETVLALKALTLIIVTDQSDTMYDAVSSQIKRTITDAEHPIAKIAAMRALSIAVIFGGGAAEETEAVMDFLLEIITSDGSSIDEEDNAEIVVAALEEWGFLASKLEDLESIAEVAGEAFVDQLDSNDAGVQIAAGENIALLYERSFSPQDEDEAIVVDKDHEDQIDTEGTGEEIWLRRYMVFRNRYILDQKLRSLANAGSKRVSRQQRKKLHLTFRDILLTFEKPTRGPRYSTALDRNTDKEFGSRLKVGLPDETVMVVDTWWKLHRLNALKRLLQSGLLVHFEKNTAVFDMLAPRIEQAERVVVIGRGAKGPGLRFEDEGEDDDL